MDSKIKKTFNPRNFIGMFLVLLLTVGWGASKPTKLELDNTLTLEAGRAARKAEKAKKTEEQAKQTEEKAKEEVQAPSRRLKEIIRKSKNNPPELDFLELPPDFVRLTGADQKASVIQKAIEGTFHKNVAIWRSRNLDLTVMTWKQPTNPEQVRSLSKEAFRKEMLKAGAEFDSFYQKTHHAKANVDIQEDGSVILMKVVSKYSESGNSRIDVRCLFFYKPEYRLNVMILGKNEDFNKKAPEIDKSLESFRKKLSEFFIGGLWGSRRD